MKFTGYLCLMAIAVATPAAAAEIDQDTFLDLTGLTPGLSSIAYNGPTNQRWQAQSLTAGKSGQLVQVDLQVATLTGKSNLILGIGLGEVTDPGFSLLGSFDISRADVPDAAGLSTGAYVLVDVSSLGLQLSSGDVLTLMLKVAQDDVRSSYGWVYGDDIGGGDTSVSVSYAGGITRTSQDMGTSWSPNGLDRGFRTWIEAGTVPEPASWALMIAGFGMVGVAARRRAPTTA